MTTRFHLLTTLLVVVALMVGCKRRKPPESTRVWLGPTGGCVETAATASVGPLACWGANDSGQIGDGTTNPRPLASAFRLDAGGVTQLALGARHGCAVLEGGAVSCWGDGSRGQLGAPVRSSLTPVGSGDEAKDGVAVAVGGAHTCVRSATRDRLRCFGADDEGQLGPRRSSPPGAPSNEWSEGASIRAFALGEAHTCVAYEKGESSREAVRCFGRAIAAPPDTLLGAVIVTELAAGDNHTCALIEDGTVRCWGANDAGQLGDGTTNDARSPVTVIELQNVASIAAGRRHTCARLRNGTVACWGDNERYQLANGTTERNARPALVVGLLGVKQLALAGDGACVLIDRGVVRCWGANDQHQLGDGTSTEHSVPMAIRFR